MHAPESSEARPPRRASVSPVTIAAIVVLPDFGLPLCLSQTDPQEPFMIRVLIDRHIAESLEPHYRDISRRILQQAVQVPGFISGETLQDTQDPNHQVIWSTWRSEADWLDWLQSDQRRAMMSELQPLLDRDERYTVLENV